MNRDVRGQLITKTRTRPVSEASDPRKRKMYTIIIQAYLCAMLKLISATAIQEYKTNRLKILEQEAAYSLGGTLKLSEDEIKVNQILMNLKQKELNESFYHPENFKFSKHYFTYKDHINKSDVYQIIKKMPKGGVLHAHGTFMMDADFLLKLTYEDNLYVCFINRTVQFKFDRYIPSEPCAANWSLLSELRNISGDVHAFDANLRRYFTIVCDVSNYSENCSTDLNDIWDKFEGTAFATRSLIIYRPVREKFIYEVLKKMYEDNVMYVEMRTGIQNLYELNGTKHDAFYTINLHREVTKRFIEEHPDFIGMKLIITKHRSAPMHVVKNTIDMARKMKQMFPDMIAGFDLVGQEDKWKPLSYFIPLLLEAKDDLNFYLHAGETNWFGTTSDENLVDAILLGTKRIGHGYALSKHPVLVDMIRRADIAVEVNVISNAVLALTSDLRNHPLANYFSLNLPVVLSSDDPGVWGAEPLTHDFYVTFVAVASQRADLRLLKQLALNSIKYSALENKRKVRMTKVFMKRWNCFLKEVLSTYDVNIDISTIKTQNNTTSIIK